MITKTILVTALDTLNLKKSVFVHSSMKALGWLEEGARTVLGALRDATGGGTIAVPTFVQRFNPETEYMKKKRAEGRTYENNPELIFDVAETPSEVGAFAEHVRKLPGAARSLHPVHSVAAIGPDAEAIAVTGKTAWGEGSPFAALHRLDADIVLWGVGFYYCTYFHAIEERVGVPYREFVTLDRLGVRDASGVLRRCDRRFFVYNGTGGSNFAKMDAVMAASGLVREVAVGDGVVRAVGVRALHEFIADKLAGDILFLTKE